VCYVEQGITKSICRQTYCGDHLVAASVVGSGEDEKAQGDAARNADPVASANRYQFA